VKYLIETRSRSGLLGGVSAGTLVVMAAIVAVLIIMCTIMQQRRKRRKDMPAINLNQE
jgi:hypothetical protein